MRTLSAAPPSLVSGSRPAFGSFRGGLPALDWSGLALSPMARRFQQKQWVYAAMSSERWWIGAAVVSLGYASKGLVYVFDRRAGRLVYDRSFTAPPHASVFQDRGHGRRRGVFSFFGIRIELGDGQILISTPEGHHIRGAVSEACAPPLSAVVELRRSERAGAGFGRVNATEKSFSSFVGDATVEGQKHSISGQIAFDHTRGILERDTTWRWALGLGQTRDGRPFMLNLVEGFVGEPECGFWLGGEVYPLGEGRFHYHPERPLEPWRVETSCGSVSFEFTPRALHAEKVNLVVVRSEFVQPIGSFRGTLRTAEETLEFEELPGVVEHQAVRW